LNRILRSLLLNRPSQHIHWTPGETGFVLWAAAKLGWTEVLPSVAPIRERTIIWTCVKEAPNVKVVHATFAISGDAAARRDVMAGCALTQTNQQQSLSIRTPSLMAMKKVLEVSESQG